MDSQRRLLISQNQARLLESLRELCRIRHRSDFWIEAEFVEFLAGHFLAGNPTGGLLVLNKEGYLKKWLSGYRILCLPDAEDISTDNSEAEELPCKASLRFLSKHYDQGVRDFKFCHLEEPPGGTTVNEVARQTPALSDKTADPVSYVRKKVEPNSWRPAQQPTGYLEELIDMILYDLVDKTWGAGNPLSDADLSNCLLVHTKDVKLAFNIRRTIVESGFWKDGITGKALEAIYSDREVLAQKKKELARIMQAVQKANTTANS